MTSHTGVSRRQLFTRAGVAGAAIFAMPEFSRVLGIRQQLVAQAQTQMQMRTLTAPELAALTAMCGRIIPADANGPGAIEAKAPQYIDHSLSGALAGARQSYAEGLAALDAGSQQKFGAPFVKLTPAQQDAVLTDIQDGPFFNLVRGHTLQGTFCDPLYGGNANFIGWDLIGYPGVRLNVTAAEQNMSTPATRNHKSAYDYLMFSKTETMNGH
ncbi:MAG: gluconate 2-dehydrogenase subunit 3 family protein [Vicinamibacterales bacterium]|nr:gluconate 2-dehydrogenase subunit 3 family protein [Vicinamibacterales bacterium]